MSSSPTYPYIVLITNLTFIIIIIIININLPIHHQQHYELIHHHQLEPTHSSPSSPSTYNYPFIINLNSPIHRHQRPLAGLVAVIDFYATRLCQSMMHLFSLLLNSLILQNFVGQVWTKNLKTEF
jgi:hypothetical protein